MDIVNTEPERARVRRRAGRTFDVPENKTGVIGTLQRWEEGERFQLEEEDEFVTVDPNTGDISLKFGKQFDYEEQTVHTFNVIITGGVSDTQKVVINVLDVNDERPEFVNKPRPFQTVVSPNAPQGELVYVLDARDKDKDADIIYKIELDLSGEKAFEVDERTGMVRTQRDGPFQVGRDYVLRVRALDKNGIPGTQESAMETLSIVVGNRPPQFYEVDYEAPVNEEEKSDVRVVRVQAKSFSNKPIKYKVTTEVGQPSDAFAVRQPESGWVFLLKRLDYDDFSQPKTYRLQVHAEEEGSGGLSSSTLLTVKVVDVNDNPPVFNLPEYVKENIDENLPAGSMILAVTATDADSYQNGKITYELSDTQNFTIRNEDGAILSKRKLDYEIPGHKYEFQVMASDSGTPSKSSPAVVRIFMKNQNDEAPRFSQSVYITNVAEDAKPGALVTTLNAVDPDGDKVTYQFKDGQLESREFKIDPQTGVLRLKDSDVSLSEPYYTLNVTAKDDGSCCAGDSPEHFSEALVTVRVIDVNNNKPVFPNCTLYRPKVPENSPAGTFVLQVTATDDDTGDNGRVRYKIESRDTVAQEPFRIDEDTGIITTRIPFDREEKNHRQITVTATDRAPRQLIGVCTFVVDITDDNDNEPKFSSTEYDTPVPERSEVGRSFLRVAAQDVDVGQNAEIGYSLIDTSGFFSINPQTGWIYVKRPLTQVKEVQAIAVATDKGVPARSSNVKIRIVITDRTGSNPPQWVGAPYPPVFISENIPVGSEVATIKARSDYFADPRLLYDIVPGSTREKNSEHHFIMRPDFKDENQAHIVVIRPLDYEKMAVFNLTIRAKNNAQVQLSNVTYLIINLQDENDNAPQFTLDPYPASVPEDSPIGTSVIQVKAEDIDSLGPNSHVIYEIMRDGPTDEGRAFSIDSESGILRTAEEFDREKKQLYLIRVLAKDRAPSTWPNRQGSPNEGGAYVRVMVEDVNDNVPFFSKKLFEAEVNEDAPKGTIVIEVTAKDRDEVTHLRYQLTTGNIGGVFDVNNETGEIRVQGELDYDEGIQIYNLTLVASDGKNENETLIRIYVRDVNDNRPIFLTPQYEANIPEEMKEGLPKKILQVSANDKDRAPPDDIRYSLRGQGQATGVFTINPQTGEIFINKPLDRDPPAGQELFTLLTLATDDKGRGNYGYADVYIRLTDINDNAPRFDGNFEGLVDENTAAGKSVMRMTAVDYDTGENAKLTYRITENVIDDASQYNIFTIDPKSGLITTRVGNLDREKIDHYKIKVEAKDAGGLTGTGIATINVGDQNDEKPEFVTKVYKATIAENLPKGTSVLSVSASDKDKDSRLRYIIVDEVGQKFFNIQDDPDTNSAVLQIAKDPTETGKAANGLDYEDLKQHFMNLTIKVNDDKESHYDFAFVEITLTDYNDNPPDFKIKHQSKRLKEDVQPGTSLVKVEATDADSEENGKFRYEIDRAVDSDPEELFTIDEKGMVYVNKTLDREKVDTHYVRILAIDEAYPYNTGTTRLTVNVDDVNDNFPQFAEDYNLIIYENEPPFQDMSPLVSATDPDIGGEPFKFWSPPPRDNPTKDQFEVHFIERGGKNRYGAARVRTLMTFDREVTKQFKVPIVMADSGNPQMTGTNTLTITIGDKNDNPHYAGIKDIFVFNYKNNMPETVIGTVYAEDKDDWDFSDKEFTFAEGVPTYFKLGNNSGDVIIRNNTPAGKYSFKVNVYDRVFSKNVVSTVNVEVKGIWDDAVFNSGSVRITGMTGEEFIAVDKDGNSKYALFQKEVAKVTGALVENVEVFSIMDRPETKGKPREVDIRFAAHGSPYYKAVKLDGAVEANLIEVERNVGINITMVRIDECLREFCEGGCSNRLEAFQTPTLVNSNKTSLVVVTTTVTAECVCLATDFRSVETCNSASAIGCRNGGTCHDSPNGYYCTCPQGFDGPQCQQTTRSFHGGGWAWFEPLKQCNKSRVSFEFMTEQADALLLYNGPMRARDGSERDFIVVELVNGKPRVTIDFGSGPLTLYVGKAENLGDEEWHRLDVVLEDKKVTFVVDRCRMIKMTESGNYDQSSCMATGMMPGRNKFLNVNTPLQLGGISNTDVGQPKMKFEKSFTGCIKNVVQDGRMYDIGNPGSSQSSSPGCARTDGVCGINKVTPRCLHGTCLGSVHSAHCRCEPGYYGRSCELEAQPRSFEDNSFVHLQLKKLPLSEQKSRIELMFRTNKPDGTLFRATGAARFDYMSLEIEAKKLHFRYNLGSVTHELTLTHVNVTDGQWHAALVERYGSDVFMSLDGGGGRRQNETLGLREHHRLIEVDQQEIYIGAAASITSVTVQSVRVYNIPSPQKDFVGCIKDVRYEEYALSLHMENQYSKIMREENVIDGCADGNECLAFPTCSLPAHVCIDMWRRAECHCPGGYLQDERGDCHDINECIISVSNMCQNSGVCVNLPGDYHCRCIDGWEGKNCNYRREEVALDLSKGALAAILVCLLLLLILVLVFVMYNRRRTKEKYPYDIDPDDDIRENIINYQDEGGGEDDQDAYDISKLRKPADSDAPGSNQASKPNHHRPPTTVPPLESARPVRKAHPQYPPGEHPDIEDFIKNRKDEADDDPGAPPRDDVRNYAYEGCGSTAGSLSSLASGTDDEDLDFDRLNNWGPRFNKLAEMYGGEED